MTPARTEVVITALGVISPLGIGPEATWSALESGSSGIGRISTLDTSQLPVHIAGEVRGFDPKEYVRPRKSLKVMARDTQFGVAAADMACASAGLGGKVDPDRFGVIFGADVIASEINDGLDSYRECMVDGQFRMQRWGVGMQKAYPLLFLKILPNMIASHVAIAQDARGPNNTLHQGDVSSLLALSEAVRVIERGAADVMIAGGASSRMQPLDWIRGCLIEELSRFDGEPAQASRPFDRHRQGQVRGEGAAALVLESRQHAQRRGATILARIAGSSSAIEPPKGKPLCGCGLSRAMQKALADAAWQPGDVGHVNAHGLSTQASDRLEATAIRQVLGSTPVTAPKSFFGNLGAASGAVELVVSLLALEHGQVPPTLNYSSPDDSCPVEVVRGQPLAGRPGTALVVNQTTFGQAAAVAIEKV